MKQNIIIRKRKSVKHGATYEYRFETASIGGQRKWISKGGFLDENTARIEGIKALNEYNTCGQVVAPTTMSFADFLEHWIVNDCSATLNEITMINYRKKIKHLIVPYLGKYRMNTIDRDKLQNLLITLHDNGCSNNTVSAVKGILTKCFNYAYYSLRHTHATVLLENGAPLKYIQQRLGHKKVDVTITLSVKYPMNAMPPCQCPMRKNREISNQHFPIWKPISKPKRTRSKVYRG